MAKLATTKSAGPQRPLQIYRGVRLQQTDTRLHFSREELRKAVDVAVAKNAEVLAARS